MQAPRYETSTILNNQAMDPCCGSVFYGLHNAIGTVQQLLRNGTCREVTVKDTVTGDVVFSAKLPDNSSFYQLPYAFDNS